MSEPFEHDVFLSHSSKDKPTVRALAERLRADGLRVWLDEWAILPGDNIPLAIEHGIQTSRILILFMSANAFSADWVHLERHAVLFRDPANRNRRFIPLRLDDAKIPDLIAQFAYLDWSKPDDDMYRRLLAVCRNANVANSEKEISPPSNNGFACKNARVVQTDVEVAPLDEIVAHESIQVAHSTDTTVPEEADEAVKSRRKKGNSSSIEIDSENNCIILKGHAGGVQAIAISPDGQTIVSGSGDKTLKLWDIRTGKHLKTLKGHTGIVLAVALSPNGQNLVSGSDDADLKLWDISNGKCLKTLRGHTRWVKSVAISPDGQTIVSGSGDITLKIWDIDTRRCLKTLSRHTNSVVAVAISLDGQTIVSGSWDTTIKLWDLQTGQCYATLEGHTGWVNALAVSPDGQTIVSGSGDKTLKIWDMQTRQCRATLEGHTSHINAIALSADGQTVVSGSGDRVIRIWDLKAILASGKAMPEEETARYTNVKVLLVGDSGVGKSGLALRLTENRFEPTISTHGAWATQLKLPDTDGKDNAAADGIEREIWL